MWLTDALEVSCPYCGEVIEIVVDLSESEQQYIEDCSVCCRPMTLSVTVNGQGGATLLACRDDD
jgi:hypothetical protein